MIPEVIERRFSPPDLRLIPTSELVPLGIEETFGRWEAAELLHRSIWDRTDELAREAVGKIIEQLQAKPCPPLLRSYLERATRAIFNVFKTRGEDPDDPRTCLLRRQMAIVTLDNIEHADYENMPTCLCDAITLVSRLRMIPGFTRPSFTWGCVQSPRISEIKYISKRREMYRWIRGLDRNRGGFEQVEASENSFRYSDNVIFTVDEKFLETESGESEVDIVNRMEEILSAVSGGIRETEELLQAGGILEIAQTRRKIYAERVRQRLAVLTSDPERFDLTIPGETIQKPVWVIFLGGPLKKGRMADLRKEFGLEGEKEWLFEPSYSVKIMNPPSPINVLRSGLWNPRFIPEFTFRHESVHWYIFDALRAYIKGSSKKEIASWFQESCAEIISGKYKKLGYFSSRSENQRKNIPYDRLSDNKNTLNDYSDYTRFGAFLAKKFYPRVSGLIEHSMMMIKEFALLHPLDSVEEHDFVEALREICHRHGLEFDYLVKEWDGMTVAQVIEEIMQV